MSFIDRNEGKGGWLRSRDPRAKMVATLLFLVAAALAKEGWSLAAVAVMAAVLWRGSGLGVAALKQPMKMVAPLALLVFGVNGAVLLAAGEGSLLGPDVFTGALASALLAAAKLLLAFAGALPLMMATDALHLAEALRRMIAPLARWGVRCDEAAFAVGAVFRFAPLLAEESMVVKRAQMARGAEFDGGSLKRRVTAWVPVIVPLFVNALRKSDTLACAVASRAFFAPSRRTSLVAFRWHWPDTVLVAAFALSAIIAAVG